jgi:phytanoyl-CoA hydroxylase
MTDLADNIATRMYRYQSVHTALRDASAFDDAHLQQFHEQGFVAIDHVFSSREVDDAKAALSFLIAGGNPKFAGVSFEDAAKDTTLTPEQRESFVRKCMYFCDYDPRLKAMAEHPALLSIVKKLVGSDVRMVQDMALLKPPHVGREKPWHQDAAYFLYQPMDKIIGTWTALDEATLENGCMHMIPGSHRAGPKAHYHVRDCQLPDDVVDVEHDVAVPLKPGGVLFFSALLHHGTPPNRSEKRRRAVQLHYASVECRKIDEGEHARAFGDPNGYAACTGKPRPVTSRVF